MTATTSIYEDNVKLLKDLDENQLWEHIDHSLAQAKAGIGQDADEVIKELKQEFA